MTTIVCGLVACGPSLAQVELRFPAERDTDREHSIVVDREHRGAMPSALSARSRVFRLAPGTHRWRVTTNALGVQTERRLDVELEERFAICRTERWQATRRADLVPTVDIERLPDRQEPCYRLSGVERERDVERVTRSEVCNAELDLDLIAGETYVIEYRSDEAGCELLLVGRPARR